MFFFVQVVTIATIRNSCTVFKLHPATKNRLSLSYLQKKWSKNLVKKWAVKKTCMYCNMHGQWETLFHFTMYCIIVYGWNDNKTKLSWPKLQSRIMNWILDLSKLPTLITLHSIARNIWKPRLIPYGH